MYYLKYRPQRIEELDNARVRETLGAALLENNWAHAYLLTGTRGSGKTTTARLIAKIVNCTNRKKGEEPCNKCASCKEITEGRSLDVLEIDGASNTGVEDIRDLREKVKLAPTSSKYKVYIIDEVHMLSTSAFNALLKTLEEPPDQVIFVLCTTEVQRLPATIVSRCLVYDFGRGTKEEIVRSLKRVLKGEDLEAAPEVLELLAKKADGSMRDGQKILEQLAMHGKKITLGQVMAVEDVDRTEKTAEKLLSELTGKNVQKCLQIVEEFVQSDGKVKELTVSLLNHLRGALLKQSGVESEEEDLDFSTSDLGDLINRLIEANALAKDSPVPQLPLEMAVIEFCSRQNSSVTTDLVRPRQTSSDGSELKDEDSGRTKLPVKSVSSGKSDISLERVSDRWTEVLSGVKPFNNSLTAFLRASRPKVLAGDFLTVEVFYKFHKDKLSEEKNRRILEKVISGIIGKDIKVKFVLPEGKKV